MFLLTATNQFLSREKSGHRLRDFSHPLRFEMNDLMDFELLQ